MTIFKLLDGGTCSQADIFVALIQSACDHRTVILLEMPLPYTRKHQREL